MFRYHASIYLFLIDYIYNTDSEPEVSLKFSTDGQLFTPVDKTIITELFCMKNPLLDGQNSWAKLPSQPVKSLFRIEQMHCVGVISYAI